MLKLSETIGFKQFYKWNFEGSFKKEIKLAFVLVAYWIALVNSDQN
jgi:hypothetical protein